MEDAVEEPVESGIRARVAFPEISREIVITIVVDCDISAVIVAKIEAYMYHDGLRIVVPVSPFGISDKQIFSMSVRVL
jgi:hypothetical protein